MGQELEQVQTKPGTAWYQGEDAGRSIQRPQLRADVAETALAGNGDDDDDNPEEPGGFMGDK
jgi:hypothetical protein